MYFTTLELESWNQGEELLYPKTLSYGYASAMKEKYKLKC